MSFGITSTRDSLFPWTRATTESGSVSRSGGADVTSNTGVQASGGTTSVGDVKTGSSQTQTLGGNCITQASQIAIVFNAANLATITAVPEPGTLLFVGTALVGLGVLARKRLLQAVAL